MSRGDLTNRKSDLSEAKRALLEKRLRGQKSGADSTGKIERRTDFGPRPLSFTQQRIWFLQQLFPDNRAYNMSEAWRLRGSLDKDALEHAIQRIAERHASLRTGFVTIGEEPLQIVEKPGDVLINLDQLWGLAP